MTGLQGMIGLGLSNMWNWLTPKVISTGDLGDFIFFRLILNYLKHEIDVLREGILERMMLFVGAIAVIALTIWIMFQGYRMVTGQMRESAVALVTNTAKAMLIVTIAVGFSMGGKKLTDIFTTDLQGNIHEVITGEPGDPAKVIDENLAWMQVALTSLDVLDTVGDAGLSSEKDRNYLLIGIGSGGPAIVAGAMLLMYQTAMALFIGLGPLFILCLLFDFTKSLFQRWLFYGIGTMFSLAVLSAMTTIAMHMVSAVAEAMWGASIAGNLLLGQSSAVGGYNSQAVQQGGMGMILTMLILTVPPMAANFFQGTLGSFLPYAQIGGSPGASSITSRYAGQPGPQGQPTGSYQPSAPSGGGTTTSTAGGQGQTGGFGGQASTPNYAVSGAGGGAPVRDEVRQGSQMSAGRSSGGGSVNNPFDVPQILQSPASYSSGASSHTGGGTFAGGPTSSGGGANAPDAGTGVGSVGGAPSPSNPGSPTAQPPGPPNTPRKG